ncbi:MAG: FAD-dependent oxidoreductase, partial [Phaeodactylibacter sp.]|nr:FAD-dependent oxidoreductase [Phaeodactylibacter sp.]
MVKTVELKVLPHEAADEALCQTKAVQKVQVEPERIESIQLVKRSLDARGMQPFYRLRYELYVDEPFSPEPAILDRFRDVSEQAEVLIVGAGPAGYFAALELIEQGLRPILFDRGKDVRNRRKDLRAIQQFGEVNPDSNYCFGEGGAGTYSDGKLYTRSHKRGSIEKALRLLVEHGAHSEILVDAHPHIGSNKLPKIVENIRETILHYGGEIHFDSQVTDLLIEERKVQGLVVNHDKVYTGASIILATGHSARDIFYLLHQKGVLLEAKPYALGVRIEHPQPLIDKIQYGQSPRDPHLPASSYKLTCQVAERGVFSFCMCPGGLVVPAATAPGEIVVNGMSMSKRNSPFANSGTVVAIELEDLVPFQQHGIFAGMEFQRSVEQAMFAFGDGGQQAPAQRLTDFIKGKISSDLPDTSYIPGLLAAPLHELLPKEVYKRLRRAVEVFGKKMPGYLTAEANVIGTESRTSSPIRIPRDR